MYLSTVKIYSFTTENIIHFNKQKAYEQKPSRYLLKHHYLTPKVVQNRIEEEEIKYQQKNN